MMPECMAMLNGEERAGMYGRAVWARELDQVKLAGMHGQAVRDRGA